MHSISRRRQITNLWVCWSRKWNTTHDYSFLLQMINHDTCSWVVLMGPQAFEKILKASKGCLKQYRNLLLSTKAKDSLNVRCMIRWTWSKDWFSELTYYFSDKGYRQKSYLRGNGIINSKSWNLTGCLLHRCRLSTSWLCKSSQG